MSWLLIGRRCTLALDRWPVQSSPGTLQGCLLARRSMHCCHQLTTVNTKNSWSRTVPRWVFCLASSIGCVLSNVQGLFQAAHLAGENDLRGIIRTFQIDTYTATGTPPQAAGVNSNTERVCRPHSSMCAAAYSDLGCRFREDYKLCAWQFWSSQQRVAPNHQPRTFRTLWCRVWRATRNFKVDSADAHSDRCCCNEAVR